jgi:acetate kinase
MSHHYVAHRSAAMLGKPLKDLKMITAHLGNGASVTAIKDGISIDTSMGFTPLEGLLMGTRTGDIDAAIILYLMGREELSMHEASTLMNKHSGLSGISQVSSDMREIEKALSEGHEQAKLAHDIYCYRLRKYIGAYAAVMGGLDVVVFTAGVGENSPLVRSKSCEGLEFLGLKIDEAKNRAAKAVEADIATDDSRVRVTVIPTNEELVIARDAKEIVEKMK